MRSRVLHPALVLSFTFSLPSFLPGQTTDEDSTFILDAKTASTYLITPEEIQALPADNYRDIVILEPGIVRIDDVDDRKYPLSIRGGGPGEEAVYIDGIDVTLQETGQNLLDLPEPGTEEIEVITGGWGPEYGDAESGIIAITTREGGRNYSGQFRMETDEFMPSGSNYGYNRAQVSVGGPIPAAEDLTFFFSGEITGLGDRHPRADVAWQASENIKLTGSLLANRDQGLLFDKGMIFWNTMGNGITKSKDILGIFGYTHTFGQSATRAHTIMLRASMQSSSLVQGPRFNLDSNDSVSFGKDLGFDDLTDILDYRVGGIPVFLEDLRGGEIDSVEEVQRNYEYNFTHKTGVDGRNPFGIPSAGFYDEDVGYYDLLGTAEENRTIVRIDYDAQVYKAHRLRSGADLRFWQVDYYSNNLTSSSFLDYYSANPDLASFYIEDRMELKDLVIDLGLRVDSFDAGVEYPSVLGDLGSERTESSRRTGVAPRISIAHPISKRIHVRGGFGSNYQIPLFSQLYSGLNIDIGEFQNTSRILGNPDLDLPRTSIFEFGATVLLSDEWLLDVAGYDKDYGRAVALRYIRQSPSMPYLKIFTNADAGHVRGMDLTLRKRFSDYYSAELAYSLFSSESIISGSILNEGFFIGDYPYGPPLGSSSRTSHVVNSQFNVKLPGDFREGTRLGKIMRNTEYYFTL